MLTSPLWPSFVILRSLLLSECELSLKALVLVINVALAYTAARYHRNERDAPAQDSKSFIFPGSWDF